MRSAALMVGRFAPNAGYLALEAMNTVTLTGRGAS